jgi:hypothetical protein
MEFVHDTSTKGKPSVWAPGVETYVEPDTWRGGKRFGLQGHNFAAHTTFSYYKSTIRSDCKFFWFEKTNVPYVKGMNANEWTDMFTHPATQEWDPQHPQNKHWDWNRNSRQSLLDSCPKKYEVYEDDPPGYWKYPEDHNAPAWRRLEFRIVIYSGEGCTRCKKRVVFLTASQYIDSKTVTWTDPNTRDAAFNP